MADGTRKEDLNISSTKNTDVCIAELYAGVSPDPYPG